jgi:ubiquinone/menaquinone biosynthesis C-methylase UbiE
MSSSWKINSRDFFNLRAHEIVKNDYRSMCHVSGRDYRIWSDQRIYNDLIESITSQLDLTAKSSILEVGCATGFLAHGITPHVGFYTGMDVAPKAIKAARMLKIPNAKFVVGNGESIAAANSTYDSAICYDVFTNFPDFAEGVQIIREMLRVVKKNGRVLIGSIPDAELQEEYARKVLEISSKFSNQSYIDVTPSVKKNRLGKFIDKIFPPTISSKPEIVCYYFNKSSFITLGDSLGVRTYINDIHNLNPYYGFRYNVVYVK